MLVGAAADPSDMTWFRARRAAPPARAMLEAVLATTVSVLATIAGLAIPWPQVFRMVVGRDEHGVSGFTWILTLCAGIIWEAIGIVERITATIIYNVLAGLGAAAVLLVLIVRRRL